ncbi:MAG: diacylglycerol kinase family protein [Patescibacteria group bacterium]
MYYYLYDSFLNKKKYQQQLARIESRLTDLGINGKINRLSFLKNVKQVIHEEIRHGVKTVVIVGDDKTFNEIINLVAGEDVVLGFIPVANNSAIAQILDIPSGEAACNTLSGRIIIPLDLGIINHNYYFTTALEFIGDKTNINCDDNYFISFENKNNIININNLGVTKDKPSAYLEIIIKNIKRSLFVKKESTVSSFKAKRIRVSGDRSIPIFLVDEKKIIKTPIEVGIEPKKIKIIAGKKRKI